MSSSSSLLLPLEAARFVNERSEDVTINKTGVTATAKKILPLLTENDNHVNVNRWEMNELNIKSSHKQAIDWVFLTDILNFSFWSDDADNKYMVRYNNKEWTGYWAWVAAVNRAMDEDIPILDASYYAEITADQLKKILRSDSGVEMPMFDERLRVLREAGQILVQKYSGSYKNMVTEASGSAVKLLDIVTREIPSLRDVAEYDGQKIAIYKRAQILIGDTWACFSGQGLGEFKDIDTITMFADYRIPQALAWFDVLKYSDSLNKKLQAKELLPNGSREEVELRAMSIMAVQLLVEELLSLLKDSNTSLSPDVKINAIMVDHFMWDYRRDHAQQTEHIPFHRTRCIYY